MQYKPCKLHSRHTQELYQGILCNACQGFPNPESHASKSLFYQSFSIVHIELVTSWPITVLWILLSWMVSSLSAAAYVHPEWFVKEQFSHTQILQYDRKRLLSTLGMSSMCYRQDEDDLVCHNFSDDFPTRSWQTTYVLFGSGCVLLTWCSILAFCHVWIVGRRNRQLISKMIGRIQLVAVFLQSLSLLLFPLVLGTPDARSGCGSRTGPLFPSGCRVGWAYAAAIAATALACHCPLLAHCTHYTRLVSPKPETSV